MDSILDTCWDFCRSSSSVYRSLNNRTIIEIISDIADIKFGIHQNFS